MLSVYLCFVECFAQITTRERTGPIEREELPKTWGERLWTVPKSVAASVKDFVSIMKAVVDRELEEFEDRTQRQAEEEYQQWKRAKREAKGKA